MGLYFSVLAKDDNRFIYAFTAITAGIIFQIWYTDKRNPAAPAEVKPTICTCGCTYGTDCNFCPKCGENIVTAETAEAAELVLCARADAVLPLSL